MSLAHAAKHLESKGRHGDDMLVHMSKNEVKGLQALAKAHGGSLSINPHTGLAEAGFLRNILPAVASAAAVATGNPELVPYITAASAAETYNRTGSLAQGALAGYSAYSGGQLGAGMVGPESAAEVTKDEALKEAAKETAKDTALKETALDAGNASMDKFLGPNVTTPPPSLDQLQMEKFVGADGGASNLVPSTTANLSANVNPYTNTIAETGAYGSGATNVANTATNLGANQSAAETARLAQQNAIASGVPVSQTTVASMAPQSTLSYNLDVLKNNALAHPMYGIGAVAPALLERPEQTGAPKPVGDHGQIMEYNYESGWDPELRKQVGPQRYTQAGYRQYADGGLAAAYKLGGETEGETALNPQYANMLPEDAKRLITKQGDATYATGGISDAAYNLGGYSDGGRLLKGPGDGVSDSIPAVIGHKQPARLADGEFVVPARIVSEIGNGSTEAGARKLYAMMDRVQKARGNTVGKGKVAKNTRADKYLPA